MKWTNTKEQLSQGAVVIYQKCEMASWGKEIKNITTTFFFQQLIRFYCQNTCAKSLGGQIWEAFCFFLRAGEEKRGKDVHKTKNRHFL